MYKKLVLKKGKEKSLLNFHPWVFSGAVASNISEIADGEVVEIFSSDKKYLATAHLVMEASWAGLFPLSREK